MLGLELELGSSLELRSGFALELEVGSELGLNWELCGMMGALAATYCLEQNGTQNHTFTPAEFVSLFREVFDDGGALQRLLTTD